jgi:hypothetical protein
VTLPERTYIVVPIEDITDAMIEDSLEGADSFRKSLDGTLGLLKFSSKYPNCCAGFTKCDHAAIVTLLDDAAWTAADI